MNSGLIPTSIFLTSLVFKLMIDKLAPVLFAVIKYSPSSVTPIPLGKPASTLISSVISIEFKSITEMPPF